VSIDALVASAGTLPEPAVDPLLYGLKEVLAHLGKERKERKATEQGHLE